MILCMSYPTINKKPVCLQICHQFSVFLKAYYKTRNTGTRNNGAWNTGGTGEHRGIVVEQRNTPEHKHNTSGKSRNNKTLHEEEQLHLNFDYKLKFNGQLESILKGAGRNVNVLFRILSYKNFEKRRIFMHFFYVTVGFYYFPLVRMFCSRKMNNKSSDLQKRCQRIVCSQKASSSGKLLEADRSVSVHVRNLQVLAAGHSKESKS